MPTRKGKLRNKLEVFAIYLDFFGEKKERPNWPLFSMTENGKKVIGPLRFLVLA